MDTAPSATELLNTVIYLNHKIKELEDKIARLKESQDILGVKVNLPWASHS